MRSLFYIVLMASTMLFQLEAADKSKMLQDLEIIQSVFETKYAPYEWKKSYFGWSLEEEIEIARIKILSLNSLSVKDYQKILHAFFMSTRDYHVHDEYFSTELSTLPFNVKLAEGKYYITQVQDHMMQLINENEQFKGVRFPKIGDEVILFDGVPIEQVIEEIKFRELGNLTSSTTQKIAEKILTTRLGSRAHYIPQGPVTLRLKGAKTLFDIEMEWLYFPELISDRLYGDLDLPLTKSYFKQSRDERTENLTARMKELSEENDSDDIEKPYLMINLLAHDLQKDRSALFEKKLMQSIQSKEKQKASSMHMEQNKETIIQEISKKKIKLNSFLEMTKEIKSLTNEPNFEGNPKKNKMPLNRESILFGKKIWDESPKSPFRVHIFKLPKSNKQIGYLRIDTYMPSTEKKVINQLVTHLAKSIRYLQEHTDALVIDQIDNPGGIDVYAFAFIALLTDRPLTLPVNQLIITQKEVVKALDIIEMYETKLEIQNIAPKPSTELFYGFPFNKYFIESEISFCKFLINQWNDGKTMTDPFPMHGMESLPPHTLANYTKPILVLVNSGSFSCGDFVPAILQDNKRAIIFGEKTAGAGGFVETHSYPNNFGLAEFSYTFSVAERIDGRIIENLGVTPDVEYTLTKKDLLYGYKEYIKAVNNTLQQMLKE